MTRLLLTLCVSFLVACDLPQQLRPIVTVEDLEVVRKKQQWQHMCLELLSPDRIEAFDKDLGGNGWEMVAVAPYKSQLIACYKKPQTWEKPKLEKN